MFFFFFKAVFSPYRLSTVFACFKAYLFIKGQPGGCCSKGLLNALLEALYIILLALFHDLQIVTSDEVDVGGDALSWNTGRGWDSHFCWLDVPSGYLT